MCVVEQVMFFYHGGQCHIEMCDDLDRSSTVLCAQEARVQVGFNSCLLRGKHDQIVSTCFDAEMVV